MYITEQEKYDLISLAKMYYEEELTQNEIAKKMSISRPQVSKLLARARRVGIVQITIRDNRMDENRSELLKRLQVKYGLKGGLILEAKDNMGELLAETAVYLGLESSTKAVIGLGWGHLLGELAEALLRLEPKATEGLVCPLIGSAPIPNRGYRVNELTAAVAQALGRQAYELKLQAFAEDPQELQEVETSPCYRAALEQWQQLNMAVLTLQNYPGVPDEATEMRFGSSLRTRRAVGSSLSYFYDEQGNFIKGSQDYVGRIPLPILKKCPFIVGLGLNASVASLQGALKSGLFTHVVATDRQVRQLLQNSF